MAMRKVVEVLGSGARHVLSRANDVGGGGGRILRAVKDEGLEFENVCLGVLVECMGKAELRGRVDVFMHVLLDVAQGWLSCRRLLNAEEKVVLKVKVI